MDPPKDGDFEVEGMERVRGLNVTAGRSIGWRGRGLALAEAAAEELMRLGWVSLRLVWWDGSERREVCL